MMEFIKNSAFFGAMISLIAYEIGLILKKKFKMAIFNPLLISIICVIGVLLIFHIDYNDYNEGGKYISYLLTPATVCLAIPLYLQLDQNIEVTNPHVYLQDIAALSMSDPKILNRLRVMPVMVLDETKPGRYVMSVSDLLKKIQKLEPSVDISPIGETDFIITYRISSATGKLFRYVKIFFVCLVSFFGAAFSIMTFNNDVDLGSLFDQFYTLVMGKSSDGFTILELSYSVGIGLGVLLFFNHFGHLKLSDDPTPMQVQMRTYEDDVNQTLIEQAERTENPEKEA